jgi:hypothetical protein
VKVHGARPWHLIESVAGKPLPGYPHNIRTTNTETVIKERANIFDFASLMISNLN